MNKRLTVFIFISSFFIGTSFLYAQAETIVSASDPYGVDFSKLEGNVKTVTEYRGPSLDNLVRRSVTNIKNKRIVSVTQYDDSGDEQLTTGYTYTDSGLLTEIRGTTTSGGIRWKYLYSYDTKGRQTEEKSYNATGALEWKGVSTYRYGRIANRTTYNSAGDVTLKEIFQYDDRGYISADITQYPDGKVLKRIIYTYTKGGHVAFEDHYDAIGFYEQVGYSYTDNGNIISFSVVGKKGTLSSRTSLQYGINGKINGEKIYDNKIHDR